MSDFTWTNAEKEAWAARQQLKPSEWAELYRVLPQGQSSRPGRWKNSNAPYLKGIMDLCVARGVSQVNIMKAAQIGVSEAVRNLMGSWAMQDPEPMGIALPSRDKGRKIVANRLIPMFETTPVLRRLVGDKAHDMQSSQLKLTNGVIIHLMWSGSPASMASDPMCRVFNDEVDKFEEWAGNDADPVSLTAKRLRTYEERAVQVNVSSPTTRRGKIFLLFDASSVKLYYFVPCPYCEEYQRLVFPQVKWEKSEEDKKKLANKIIEEQSAWYECERCSEKIGEQQRPAMIAAGRWGTEDESIVDAEAVERWPDGTRLGIQCSALYCLWESFSNIAGEFLRAKGSLQQTMDFRTGTLGEPFEDQVAKLSSSVFSIKSQTNPLGEGLIPRWGVRLLATIDTQHDHFYVVIRAWGPELRSHRVWHGKVDSFEDLHRICFNTPWAVEENIFPAMTCDLVLIDSGGTKLKGEQASRTSQVYRWVLPRQAKVRAIKGTSKPKGNVFIWPGKGFLDTGAGKKNGREVRIWHLDTHHFNDELQDLIDGENADAWALNARNDEEYNQHMSSVHKVAVRRGNQLKEEWIPTTSGARIDYRDCEVYQIAGAYMLNVHTLPPIEEIERHREQMKLHAEQVEKDRVQRNVKRDPFAPTSLRDFL